MALRVSASSVALCLLFSLIAVAHCVPLEEANDLATDASAAAVTAVPDESEEILRFGVALEGEAPMEEEKEEEAVVNPVAEADPDSHGEEELTALKPSVEGEDEKKEQINDDEDEDEDERKEKTKNKRKKHDCKGKKKIKKHEQSNDEGEEKMKKQIYRHHHVRVEKVKTKKRPYHNSGNDSDDEDEQEKKVRRWRKAISRRSRFGHGRRSQREESQTEEVKN